MHSILSSYLPIRNIYVCICVCTYIYLCVFVYIYSLDFESCTNTAKKFSHWWLSHHLISCSLLNFVFLNIHINIINGNIMSFYFYWSIVCWTLWGASSNHASKGKLWQLLSYSQPLQKGKVKMNKSFQSARPMEITVSQRQPYIYSVNPQTSVISVDCSTV